MKVFQFEVGMMQNLSYVIIEGKEAAIIDPSFDFKQQMKKIEEEKAELKYIILTHNHFDHNHSVKKLKREYNVEVVMHEDEPGEKDLAVKDGDVLRLGKVKMQFIYTPGHTSGGMCILAEDKLFTGDTLFVEGIGRTDLPGSDHAKMEESLKRLSKLDDDIIIYPGHDYGGRESTIGKQKQSGMLI